MRWDQREGGEQMVVAEGLGKEFGMCSWVLIWDLGRAAGRDKQFSDHGSVWNLMFLKAQNGERCDCKWM